MFINRHSSDFSFREFATKINVGSYCVSLSMAPWRIIFPVKHQKQPLGRGTANQPLCDIASKKQTNQENKIRGPFGIQGNVFMGLHSIHTSVNAVREKPKSLENQQVF